MISLSVGKSLTLRGAALEATELLKTHRCKDPICDTHLWKVKHELDMARLQMKSLEAELQAKGIQSPLSKSSFETRINSKDASCDEIADKQNDMDYSDMSQSLTCQHPLPKDIPEGSEKNLKIKPSRWRTLITAAIGAEEDEITNDRHRMRR